MNSSSVGLPSHFWAVNQNSPFTVLFFFFFLSDLTRLYLLESPELNLEVKAPNDKKHKTKKTIKSSFYNKTHKVESK